jgi:hypothetical protein
MKASKDLAVMILNSKKPKEIDKEIDEEIVEEEVEEEGVENLQMLASNILESIKNDDDKEFLKSLKMFVKMCN